EMSNAAQRELLLDIAKSDYAATTHQRTHLGIAPHLLAGVIVVIPKIGRLRILDTKAPQPSTEELYIRSMGASVNSLRGLVLDLSKEPKAALRLRNLDLDTGAKVVPGRAAIVDKAYSGLL